MGLLQPTQGDILINKTRLRLHEIPGWQHIIAHVPQETYLLDMTLAENIALGVPHDEIDIARFKEAIAKAKLEDFIGLLPWFKSNLAKTVT